jgi:FUS-interacting serine-arginine-rich protein 1
MFEPTPRYIVVESLAEQFRRFFLDDPIEKALSEGKLLWGDILCSPEEEERVRVLREQREAEAAAPSELEMLYDERSEILRYAASRFMTSESRDEALYEVETEIRRLGGHIEPTDEQPEAEETGWRRENRALDTFLHGLHKGGRTGVGRADCRRPTREPAEPERDVPAFPAGRLTLMAKNLPRDIDVKELRTIFEQYGAIRDIYIPKNMDKSSPYFGTIKGFALIKFLKPDDSARAFAAQYALINIRGKNIVLEPASADR